MVKVNDVTSVSAFLQERESDKTLSRLIGEKENQCNAVRPELKRLEYELSQLQSQRSTDFYINYSWRIYLLELVLESKGMGWCSLCEAVVQADSFQWVQRDQYSLEHVCTACYVRLGQPPVCPVEVREERWGVVRGDKWISMVEGYKARLFNILPQVILRITDQPFTDLWKEHMNTEPVYGCGD